MSLVQKYCALVLIVVSASVLVENRSYNNGLIFYDLKTKQAYLPPTVSVSRGRGLANIKFSDKGSIWSTFGKPCDCAGPLCGCCVGIKVKQYNFDQKMCANVSYVQRKEEINMEVFLNEKQSAKYAVSARNPSPFCIPVMVGIPMSMCVQMSNVGLQGDNMNACMDFMVQLASTQLFEMHFQCMQMGTQGVQWLQPGGAPVIPPSESKITDRSDNVSDEYYDEEEQNEIDTGAEEENDNVVNDKPEQDENKAEEEVDYNDLMETVSEETNKRDEEETKDNEVVLSHEKPEPIDEEILKESNETDKVPLLNDEEPINEESSDVASFVGLTNSGEISTEANNNESDFNKSIAITTEPMETVTEKQNQHVIMANIMPLTMATTAVGNNDIDNIDNAVTSAAIVTTTVAAATTTAKTPTLTAPKTTEATPTATTAAPATATTFVVNNDNDNSQDNDSDYGDEESDEDDEGADEEEEEEEDGEDDEEVEDTVEVKDPVKEKEQISQATAENTENVSVASNVLNSTDRHEEEEEDEGEENDSETEEEEDEEEDDEDYEETETSATTNSNESQPIFNGFITPSIASTAAVSPDDIVEKTDEHTDINSNNPQLSSTDAELSNADSSDSGVSNSSGNIAAVEAPIVGNIVNMSQITDTATPLTRASKLLTLRKQSHPQQQQWHYQQHQLHHRHARHQRNNHRHHVA